MKRTYTIKASQIVEIKRRRYARLIVSRALRNGDLTKGECCDLCSKQRSDIQAHHVDYGAPLRVMWLCQKCHGLAHRKGHPLNPACHPQTPMPAAMPNDTVVVTSQVPIAHFLAIKKEAQKQKKTVSALLREHIVSSYEIESNQLRLPFMEEYDNTQTKPVEGISGLVENENILHKSEVPRVQKVRSERPDGMRRVEQKLFPFFERHGSDALIRLRASPR